MVGGLHDCVRHQVERRRSNMILLVAHADGLLQEALTSPLQSTAHMVLAAEAERTSTTT